MVSVLDWMIDSDVWSVDVCDGETDLGAAWEAPCEGCGGMAVVQRWILAGTEVSEEGPIDLTADVWSFVWDHFDLLCGYSERFCDEGWHLSTTDKGMANGVRIVHSLMLGGNVDGYAWLAGRIKGVA
ncbi:MAG: hypothetical protein IKP53_08420 [Candidatus Methanomethylophilaceae archaeon]|nr:hypothetical protein [Candidatus Methanomethylophilaceae archaeon]